MLADRGTSDSGRAGRGATALLSRPEFWLGVIVFVSGAYFCGSGSWNQNARLDAIFAFVEPGPHRWTFRIDTFLPFPEQRFNTGDFGRFNGHYYANKAPGTQLLGVLAYLPIYAFEVLAHADIYNPAVEILNGYLVNLWVSVVPLMIGVISLFRFLQRQMSQARAARLALLGWFGTALFPYSTQLWGHTTAAAFVLMALGFLDVALAVGDKRSLCATGLLLGLSVLCDYLVLALLAVVILGIAFGGWRHLLWLAIGGFVPLVLLFGYQSYCFGGPLTLPTAGESPAFMDERLFLGLFGPVSLKALFGLALGIYRGIFLQMPLLIGALVGFGYWWRRNYRDRLLQLVSVAFLATLTLVASFNGWQGGATVCARYLIPVIPLLVIALKELPKSRWANLGLAVCAVPSVSNMLAVAAVSPVVNARSANPLFGTTYGHLLSGRLHPYPLPIRLQRIQPDYSQWKGLAVWNWGDVLGLTGLTRLLPLLAVVGVCLVVLWRSTRRSVVTPPVTVTLA